MKYIKSYNESLRDKMVGKTEDDILNSMKPYVLKVLNGKKYSLHEVGYDSKVYDKLTKLFNKSNEELYLVNDKRISYFFKDSIKDKKSIKIKDGNGYWECYIDNGLAHWVSKDGTQENLWIFDDDKILGNINESLRDKMTAKSDKEVLDALSKITDPYDKLYSAVEHGLIDEVKKIIENEVKHNLLDININNGMILGLSVMHNDTDIVEYLFSKGADPNVDGGRLIRYPIEYNNMEILKMFLDNGYELLASDGYCDALHVVQRDGKSQEMINLIKQYIKK